MALEVDGKTIETTANGYLVNMEDWSEAVGAAIAAAEPLEMTEKHWDVVNYLRDLGNTVIVVEHDEEAVRSADHVLDLGPGAGVNGGQIVAEGTPEEILANPASVTGKYLSGELSIAVPGSRTEPDDETLS